MRAFSGSVSEWCGQAEAARKPPRLPPSDRAASARTQAASAPASAWRPGGFRPASARLPPSIRAASVQRPRGFRSASARLPFRSGGSREEAETASVQRPRGFRFGQAEAARKPRGSRRTTLGCRTTLVRTLPTRGRLGGFPLGRVRLGGFPLDRVHRRCGERSRASAASAASKM